MCCMCKKKDIYIVLIAVVSFFMIVLKENGKYPGYTSVMLKFRIGKKPSHIFQTHVITLAHESLHFVDDKIHLLHFTIFLTLNALAFIVHRLD